ncbi:hypothetical protein C8J57DRAFT_1467186 [Mycena rebaudengoi]|nr:hypothetical protein C8J57DRAFT_1467186 [Mycena rebaudengoi]
MSLPNSVLAWPHPLMITAASSHASNAASTTWRTSPTILASVVTVRATTAPRMTTYHLKGACIKRAAKSFLKLCSTITTARNSASTAMTTSARASCVSS